MAIEYAISNGLPRENLDTLRPDDLVKVVVRDKPTFPQPRPYWISILRIDGNRITGRVQTHMENHVLKVGDEITVDRENVLNFAGWR
jgi:hypothetical protein